jgi:hypothetical protein
MSPSGVVKGVKVKQERIKTGLSLPVAKRVRRKPSSIGARNPYAVYRARYGNNPFPAMTPEEARHQLLALDEKQLEFNRLFDPCWGSCLFCQKTIETVRPRSVHIEANRDSVFRPTGSHGADPSEDSRSSSPVGLPGNYLDCQQRFSSSAWLLSNPALPTDPASIYWPWFNTNKPNSPTLTGFYPDQVSPSFVDPSQGPIPDCYFLASLCSIAWYGATYRKIILSKSPSADIGFLDTTKGLVQVSGSKNVGKVPTDFSLVIDSATPHPVPVGARTPDGDWSWVPYYEKAFARYLEFTGKLSPPSPNPDNPEICRIPCGYAGETLRALMQKNLTALKIHNMEGEPLGSTKRDPVNVWKELKKICETDVLNISSANPGTPNAWKMKYPVVAWTNCSGDPNITNTPAVCAAPRGSLVEYNDDLMCASHAYSLLGLHKNFYGTDEEDFVILRNPWGESWGFEYGQTRYSLSGRPNPDGSVPDTHLVFGSITDKNSTPYRIRLFYESFIEEQSVMRPENGIFALKKENFVNYFAGFSWVIA